MIRDAQRAKVYAAEEFVRTIFDRAAERGNPVVEFFGTSLTLPPEARFGSVTSVQEYVDRVLSLAGVRERWPGVIPVRVRSRKGVTAAHYERPGGREHSDPGNGHAHAATIAVPADRSCWALRELVVLHEIAHHLTHADQAHGPDFVATFTELTAAVMGAEAAHVLRVVYAREGVR